jgi:predicted metal-dependent phosphoesterase TrpH
MKIDLHTHSSASVDGGITAEQYRFLLKVGTIDQIAITDHNRIDMALELQAELGNKIIVGEEITTQEGDIIGLFITDLVPKGLPVKEAVQAIKKQGGIVYVPHPFETIRSGINLAALKTIADDVDVVEAPNGRSIQPGDDEATDWARSHKKAICGSSDAHRAKAVGKTYTATSELLTKENIITQLESAKITYRRPSLFDLLAPKYNRLMNKRNRRNKR